MDISLLLQSSAPSSIAPSENNSKNLSLRIARTIKRPPWGLGMRLGRAEQRGF